MVSTQSVDEVTPRDEHHPGHELRAGRVVPLSGLPKANENLLYRILGLRRGGKHLAGGLEDESTETIVKPVRGYLIALGHRLHQHPVFMIRRIHASGPLSDTQLWNSERDTNN